MPATHGHKETGADQPADVTNRAARRGRNKDTAQPRAHGKVQSAGRAVQGPRQWSVRKGG